MSIKHERGDGFFYYRFDDDFRAIIKESRIFARLQMDVMLALSRNYALDLYEMVQKRGNLKDHWFEDFTVGEFCDMLTVRTGKPKRFSDLNKCAIKPAIRELAGLSYFCVEVTPFRRGGE